MNVVDRIAVLGALAVVLLIGAPAGAQNTLADDRTSVIDAIDERPSIPTVNTALSFTNVWPRAVKVKLEAFDHEGQPAGGAEFEIPPRGLKYMFVSRILRDPNPRFVGWVAARTSLPVSASAVLLGIGTTDLPVERFPSLNATDVSSRRRHSVLFPLTAAF
jgi:hypothetical protein